MPMSTCLPRAGATERRAISFGGPVRMASWWAILARTRRRMGKDNLSALAAGTDIRPIHPVLTRWFAGPKADRVSSLARPNSSRWASPLAEIFDLPPDSIRTDVVASRAINWGNDPSARGAYSYATPKTRAAQLALRKPDRGAIFFARESLYAGPEMGTVEAALASGQETAQMILAAEP